MPEHGKPLDLFYSYSHRDEKLRDELEKHLSLLKRQEVISAWHDRKILAGEEWKGEIDEHLDKAHVILLLISSDFLASHYCYDLEMNRALQRHERREARVIPVILRPCDWTSAPFAKLQALPKDAKPVTKWRNRDEAFLDVADGIRKVAEEFSKTAPHRTTPPPRASLWNVPFPHNPFFTGREKVLEDLRQSLTRERKAALSQIQAISGLGGIGKTQTAVEYAYRHREDYEAVLWVRAETRDDILSGFLEVARLLNLPGKDNPELDGVALAVKSWLEGNTNYLLVFDNAGSIFGRESDGNVGYNHRYEHSSAAIHVGFAGRLRSFARRNAIEWEPAEPQEWANVNTNQTPIEEHSIAH